MNQLVLLTGFLGAGKTTFLNHILQEFQESKVGLVVNEFSGTGVDGALLRHDIPGADMVELNNGSIFCACIKDSFVDALVALSSKGLDYIFVEASGLADPSSISAILEQLRTLSGVVYDYQGAICLIDALHFPKYVKLLVALTRQVEYSRAVILNKTDLVEEAALAELEQIIRSIHPNTALYRTTYAQVSLREILSQGGAEETAPQASSNTQDTRPVTVTLTTRETVPLQKLRSFLAQIAPCTYRVKGFCMTDEGVKSISMVGAECEVTSWNQAVEMTQLVIISSVGIKAVSEVLNTSKLYFQEPVKLE